MNYFKEHKFFEESFFTLDYFKRDYFKCPFFGGAFTATPATPAKPAVPTGLSVQGITKTEIEFSFLPVAHAVSYNVNIKDGTNSVTGYPKDISVPHESFSNLAAGKAYTITVKACNKTGCSAQATKDANTAS